MMSEEPCELCGFTKNMKIGTALTDIKKGEYGQMKLSAAGIIAMSCPRGHLARKGI